MKNRDKTKVKKKGKSKDGKKPNEKGGKIIKHQVKKR
jgi:hypothetical protein